MTNIIHPDIFYRLNEDGDACILDADGNSVTTLDVDNTYPIGSDLSVRYEHTGGIVLSVADAVRLGIPNEFSCVAEVEAATVTTTATQFLVTALHGEVQADGSVTYRDDTTRRRYVCPARDLALLSQMLDDPTLSSGDAYSRWCSDTSHAEVAE